MTGNKLVDFGLIWGTVNLGLSLFCIGLGLTYWVR